ncbi:spore coat protein YsxE [Sporolactobacillus shoreicorticis]|uniref:Spore coat protein YsxE n=1 Tax=Sporolactobacillus shoreicorticis TaxID=1923877 RepID=A0ABW5RYW6_9BACL|nr:spore coat protein YsxE [Sporolactobacillus shoreicorticis]MCO7127939.1 spore coat protein YsxE [Sporolactobacillus shoreicorticis]
MEQTDNNRINRILFQYDLVPYNLSVRGNLIRVDTPAGSFALKQKALNDRQIRSLQTVYALIRRMVIDAVCPLPSKYGDLVIRGTETSYYLLPWFNETVDLSNLQERYRHLFIKTGQLHRKTLEKKADCSGLYQDMVRVLNQRQMVWEQFLYKAEHHVYPSPFEQAVLKSAFIYLENMQRSHDFFSHDKDDEGKNKTMRRALCHGRLSPLHLLIENERSCLTNFENSEDGFFIVETAMLFEQANVMLGSEQTNWRDFYESYSSVCPLTDEEKDVLVHFLLFPSAHAELLSRYLYSGQLDEQWFVKRWTDLCQAHRNMFTSIKENMDEEQKRKEERQAKEKAVDEKKEK